MGLNSDGYACLLHYVRKLRSRNLRSWRCATRCFPMAQNDGRGWSRRRDPAAGQSSSDDEAVQKNRSADTLNREARAFAAVLLMLRLPRSTSEVLPFDP